MEGQFKWHGMDRSEINWHPVIDENKCTGCGLCVVTCGEKRNVFGYDKQRRKAVVMFPDNCMVGCINCMVGCLWNAISFPDEQTIKNMARSLPKEALAKELAQKIEKNPELVM
ncbi:MAG: 4Fe-4S binding protein [Thaumarchaeota archaeon]|nr:4Fe-4S binding protein [Nitrososphaerota archaeon]